MQKITPDLWFDDQAEEAARSYASVFPNLRIATVSRYDKASTKASGRPQGSAMTCGVSWQLIHAGNEPIRRHLLADYSTTTYGIDWLRR